MIDLDAAEKLANGFRGRFEFKPDDAAGYDRLEYLSADGDPYEIAERLDREVAEPLAEMLNMFGPLIAEVRQLRAELAELLADDSTAAQRYEATIDDNLPHYSIDTCAHDEDDTANYHERVEHAGEEIRGLKSDVRRLTDELDEATTSRDHARAVQERIRRAMWSAADGLDDHGKAHMAVACRNSPGGCFCGMHVSQIDGAVSS